LDAGAGALQNFLEKTKDKTPEERGRLLAYEEEIRKIHDGFAQQGQTAVGQRHTQTLLLPSLSPNQQLFLSCSVSDSW